MTDDKGMSDLARMLRQLRRREARRRGGAELTYRELATRTGWSLGIVAQYFSGKSLPPVDRFDVLVRLLGASAAELGVLATARDQADDRRRGPTPEAAKTTAHRAEVRLLGPVEVVGPAGAAALVGVRQRALIGLLALDADRVVTKTRLMDALWGEVPPRTAIESLYSHVARVRSSLDACGLPGLLKTCGPGYVLAVRPDEVDVTRFAKLAAQSRRALALWRGEALADASSAGWVVAEVDRLHEMRLGVQEDLLDARLRLGEHLIAADELDRLLVSYPARERLVELFMIALYRNGRHNEAVEAYQRLRVHLAEQLGVEPGPRAAEVFTAVLRRSPDLDRDLGPHVAARTHISRPAQLPSRVGHFVGRDAELAILDGLLSGAATAGRVGVVCGRAGMGKTDPGI